MKMPSLSARTLLIALVSVQSLLLVSAIVVWNSLSAFVWLSAKLYSDSDSALDALLLTRSELLLMRKCPSDRDNGSKIEWIRLRRAYDLSRTEKELVELARSDHAPRETLYWAACIQRRWLDDTQAIALLDRALRAPHEFKLDHDFSDKALQETREFWSSHPSPSRSR